MEKTIIIELAKKYIENEKESGFCGEVEELLSKTDDAGAFKELEDRFYRNLEFGTGGLRGITGGGYNRMNTLVVKNATQGLANYLIKTFPKKAAAGKLSAVIAYDSRHYSAEFAEAAALVFTGNGIKTWLFSGMRPTPELSFAIRHLGCDTGIVVTASHNPPNYNGYKAYWNDGSQIIPPHDTGIIDEVNAVAAGDGKNIKDITREEAAGRGLLEIIDREIDEPYHAMVKSRLFRLQLIKEKAGGVKIVYTPLHGTGAMHVEKVLGDLGLKVITVPEQREGDGDFPTVSFPNPEEAAALEMAIELGKKEKADIVMATDPDADRFGIAVSEKGCFILLTGNQTGVLLVDYIFLSLKEQGKLPANAAMINTIVTTGMQRRVAQFYGAECYDCLTGFKWIADLMRRWEKGLASGDPAARTFVFGAEESYGYLVETEARDKDGISAAALTAEMTLYWRSKGKSLLDRLNELYEICGYWQELGISKYFQGSQGQEIMKSIMDKYRSHPPASLGNIPIIKIRDIEKGTGDLPPSDVLQFFLEDGTVVSVRPSGTEPKIKFYASCCAEVQGGKEGGGLEKAKAEAASKLDVIEKDIRQIIG